MIRSIALAVSWGGDRSNRLRSLVLAGATIVVTAIALVAVSAGLLAERVNDRAASRVFAPAAPGETASFSRGALFDSINGEPILVYYWRIEIPGVTIPGIPVTAQEGDWFVSPELERRIQTERALTGRFEEAEVIGDVGVGAADELVAYRLVGPDVDLDERLTTEAGPEWIGLDAGISGATIALGAIGLVLIVGIGFLRAALGPVAVGLERRLKVLHILGASRSILARLVVLSTAAVTIPASALTAAVWYGIAPRLTSVPLVGERTLRGDLAVPLWAAALTALAVAALSSALGLRHLSFRVGSRPTSRIPQSPPRWRILPLAGSVALILYSAVLSGSGGVRLLLTGLLAASLSITFALPVLIDRLGASIARVGSTLTVLVGRRLSWNATTSAQPLMALAGLAVVVPVAASYIAVARAGDETPPVASVEAIQLGGELDQATLDRLEVEAGGVFVDVYFTLPAGNAEPEITWVAECEEIGQHVAIERCGPDGIIVAQAAAPAFAGLDQGSTIPPPGSELGFRLLITSDSQEAESVLRSFVVNSGRTDLGVTSAADRQSKEARLVPWLLTGLQLATIGAFIALLLSVVTAASQSARTRMRLVAVGADLSIVRRLAAAESFVIVAVVGIGGVGVGTVGAVAYAMVDGSVSPNYWPSSVIAAATLAAAAMAGFTAATHVTTQTVTTALNNPD